MPTETLKESAWERQMSLSGLEAYEQARYQANGDVRAASESAAGQKLMRKLIDRATVGIEQLQKDMLTLDRVDRGLKATTLLVPAETSALLTLKFLFDRAYASSSSYDMGVEKSGANLQVICRDIAASVELELNFRNWISESKAAAKEYAKAKGYDSVPKSMAERLIEEQGISRASYFRWKKTFEELQAYKWTKEEKLFCGEALLVAVVQALPDAFEIAVIGPPTKSEKRVRMTDAFREKFDQIESKVASLQVVKKPMLTRPRRWTKEEQ